LDRPAGRREELVDLLAGFLFRGHVSFLMIARAGNVKITPDSRLRSPARSSLGLPFIKGVGTKVVRIQVFT
jgi:hypothetical protein